MAVITPIGTAIKAVTNPCMTVPWIACTAPPPTTRLVIPRWELVHHWLSSSIAPPLLTTLQRIHARGTIAIANAAHITTRASWLRRARPRDRCSKPDPDPGAPARTPPRFEADVIPIALIR